MSQTEELYEGEMSFEDAVRQSADAITETLDRAAAAYSTENPPVDEPVAEPPEGQTDASSAAGAEPATAEAPAEPEDKALVRLVKREAALDQRTARIEEREAALAAREAQIASVKDWEEEFQADPVGFLRERFPNMNLASTAEELWYGQDPSKAPGHQRALQEARAARRDALKARRGGVQAPPAAAGEEKPAADDETAFNQYLGAMRSYVEAPPETYPLVSRFVKKHGVDRAHEAVFRHAQRVAQATNGERVLTPAEAAAELENELKALQLSDGPIEEPSTAPMTEQAVQSPPTSIRNSHSQVQPDRKPVDQDSDEYLRYRGFLAVGYSEADAKRMSGL